MVERLTGEAKAEVEGMVGQARSRSAQLLVEAGVKADGLVDEARTRAVSLPVFSGPTCPVSCGPRVGV